MKLIKINFGGCHISSGPKAYLEIAFDKRIKKYPYCWFFIPALRVQIFPMGGIVIDGKEHLQMMEIQFTIFFLNFLMSPITFYIRTKWDNVSPFND